MQVSMEFRLPARVRKRGKWFVSSCELLDVHSQGLTRAAARRNLRDALASFLASCYERGTLDAVLRDCGFVAHTNRKPHSPARRRAGATLVRVPVPFAIDSSHARASA
jgi:predicted RNase H-like HicB family nuclease